MSEVPPFIYNRSYYQRNREAIRVYQNMRLDAKRRGETPLSLPEVRELLGLAKPEPCGNEKWQELERQERLWQLSQRNFYAEES